MCLTLLLKEYDPPVEEVREGWKAVRVYDAFGYATRDSEFVAFLTPSHEAAAGHRYRFSQWYRDPNNGQVIHEDGVRYPCGYHVFHTREEAYRWELGIEQIVKVNYRKTLVTGRQVFFAGSGVVDVAEEIMFLPPEGAVVVPSHGELQHEGEWVSPLFSRKRSFPATASIAPPMDGMVAATWGQNAALRAYSISDVDEKRDKMPASRWHICPPRTTLGPMGLKLIALMHILGDSKRGL